MANPIKETPVLYGKDARKFAAAIANPIPFSKERVEGMYRHYEMFKQALERGRIRQEQQERERKERELQHDNDGI
jgi:hypothetical protein